MMAVDRTISCVWVRERLDAHVDGELPPDERAAVASHLDECAGCAAEAGLARHVAGSLRSLSLVRCPDRVIEALNLQVDTTRRSRAVHRRQLLWRPSLAGAVAMLLLAVTALVGGRQKPSSVGTAEVARAEAEVRWVFNLIEQISRRTGLTVREDVIQRRVVVPVRRALDRSLERSSGELDREVGHAS